MSKLADSLRAIRVCNNWEMLKRFGTKQDVVVDYHVYVPGRAGFGSYMHTEVWSMRPHSKLEESQWPRNTFFKKFRGKRSDSLPEALAWVAAELECGPLVPSPFRGYLPVDVVKKAKDALKKQEQESPGCQTKSLTT